jgi:hypothetical protein
MEQPPRFFALLTEFLTPAFINNKKYMLFKGSNNLVQIYRLFVITGNYGRRSFSKYGIFYYDVYDC